MTMTSIVRLHLSSIYTLFFKATWSHRPAVLPLPLLVFDMGVIVRGDDRLSTAAEVPSLLSSSMSLLGRLGFNAAI